MIYFNKLINLYMPGEILDLSKAARAREAAGDRKKEVRDLTKIEAKKLRPLKDELEKAIDCFNKVRDTAEYDLKSRLEAAKSSILANRTQLDVALSTEDENLAKTSFEEYFASKEAKRAIEEAIKSRPPSEEEQIGELIVNDLKAALEEAGRAWNAVREKLLQARDIYKDAKIDYERALEAESSTDKDADIIAEWGPNEDKTVLPPKEILLAKEAPKTPEELLAESDATLEETFKAKGITEKREQKFYINTRNQLVAKGTPVERATTQVEEYIGEDRYNRGVPALRKDE